MAGESAQLASPPASLTPAASPAFSSSARCLATRRLGVLARTASLVRRFCCWSQLPLETGRGGDGRRRG
eukprot:15445242-Alexandrium_andersonii.AAC.1